MSSLGIALSVGTGALIGFMIVAPHASAYALMMGFLLYGALAGFIFHLYELALEGWKPPSRGRR
jgi:hypothetical protein